MKKTIVVVIIIAIVTFLSVVWISSRKPHFNYCVMAVCNDSDCQINDEANTVCNCTADIDADGKNDWEGKCTFEGDVKINNTSGT